jgi:methylase of polypeptide subunit release factors
MFNFTDTSDLEKEFLETCIEKLPSNNGLNQNVVHHLIWFIFFLFLLDETSFFDRIKSPNKSKEINLDILSPNELFQVIIETRESSILSGKIGKEILEFILKQQEETPILLSLQALVSVHSRFNFSLEEGSSTAIIKPYLLSIALESCDSLSRPKKKIGKVFTNPKDAELLSYLTLFRYLNQKWTDFSKEELYSIFNDKIPPTGVNISTTHDFGTELSVLDPACGSGTFLIQIARLYQNIGRNLNRPLKIYLCGIEVESTAILTTQLRLFLLQLYWISNRSKPRIELQTHLIETDFLLQEFSRDFDIFIGNPPYVRHEDIGSNQGIQYKSQLHESTRKILDDSVKLDRKSDLYVYFCIKCLNLLKRKTSVLSLLTSNAWLEVQYGRTLQQNLLQLITQNHLSKCEIIHQAGSRLWQQVGINSIILIASKSTDTSISEKGIYFTEALTKISKISKEKLREGLIFGQEFSCDDYRTELINIRELSATHKWAGQFLRTSMKERNILKKIKGRGIIFSSIAKVRFGIKTGANNFFYIKIKDQSPTNSIALITNALEYNGKCETKFLVPIIKSPLEVDGYMIPVKFNPNVWLFQCRETPADLQGTFAYQYIQWGENVSVPIKQGKNLGHFVDGFSSLTSVNRREYWYSLPEIEPPQLLWTKSYHDRPGCLLNLAQCIPDQRFYSIYVNNSSYVPIIFTYLNSSIFWALMEEAGNTNMGFGVLDTNVYWLKSVNIPTNIPSEHLKQLNNLYHQLIKKKTRKSILEDSLLRDQIDLFYANILDLAKPELRIIRNYIHTSIRNRLQSSQ